MKNIHAQALGRLGGLKGGLSRSEKKRAACRENGKKGGRRKQLLDAREAHVPNAETIAALEEIENGGGKSCKTVEELFRELNTPDARALYDTLDEKEQGYCRENPLY